MMEDLAGAERDKAEIQEELEQERGNRQNDNDIYKERLANVEQGVEKIIQDLENRLEHAEHDVKEARSALESVESDRDIQVARAERAEARLRARQDDGQVASTTEMALAQDQIMELTSELSASKKANARLEEDLVDWKHELEGTRAQIRALERKARDVTDEGTGMDHDLRIAKALAAALQEQLDTQQAELNKLRDERDIDAERIHDLEHDYMEAFQEADALKMQLERVRVAAQESEDALQEAEHKMTDDARDISQLRAQVSQLQRDSRDSSRRSIADLSTGRPAMSSSSRHVDAEDLEVLRAELDAANAEIGRLKFMSGQSNVRSAITKAKDARLEDLERRNEQLEEELVGLNRFVQGASSISNANVTLGNVATPMAVRQTMNRINNLIRTPKTPGPPLKDPSWAHTTGQESLYINIANIQRQLDQAEADLGVVNTEDKEAWGFAQLGAGELRRRLREANTHVAGLKEELSALQRAAEHMEREHQEQLESLPQSVPPCTKCEEREQDE
ncbi:hypothetical protein BKA62DRAFT_622915 [Auriculariales sp. MPI-PUGE-AT-0066]|nr:hypothetical protein BKA62DRAFT_622915 [Auriculariales sp. MPI-PUGE-AT-0066]